MSKELNKCLGCEALILCANEQHINKKDIYPGESKCIQLKREVEHIHDPLGAHFKGDKE